VAIARTEEPFEGVGVVVGWVSLKGVQWFNSAAAVEGTGFAFSARLWVWMWVWEWEQTSVFR